MQYSSIDASPEKRRYLQGLTFVPVLSLLCLSALGQVLFIGLMFLLPVLGVPHYGNVLTFLTWLFWILPWFGILVVLEGIILASSAAAVRLSGKMIVGDLIQIIANFIVFGASFVYLGFLLVMISIGLRESMKIGAEGPSSDADVHQSSLWLLVSLLSFEIICLFLSALSYVILRAFCHKFNSSDRRTDQP